MSAPDISNYRYQINESLRFYGGGSGAAPPGRPPFDHGRPAGDDDGMEERLRAVEDRLLKIETKSDTFATKEDLRGVEAKIAASESNVRAAINEQTWKMIVWTTGLGGALVTTAFFIARHFS